MLLENKNAVIYGAGGDIGSAVARAFAREGARVFLTGRTLATLSAVAEEIIGAGGKAEAAQPELPARRSRQTSRRVPCSSGCRGLLKWRM